MIESQRLRGDADQFMVNLFGALLILSQLLSDSRPACGDSNSVAGTHQLSGHFAPARPHFFFVRPTLNGIERNPLLSCRRLRCV